MVWALTHFLVGSIISLLVALVLDIMYGDILEYRMLIITFAGIWSLLPDIDKLAILLFPDYADRIENLLHDSFVTNVFFFHNFLDRSVFRNAQIETLAVVILVFCLVIVSVSIQVHRY